VPDVRRNPRELLPSYFETELSPFEPLSDEARAHVQEVVDAAYRTFVADVAKGRGVSKSTVEANYGHGRVFTAGQALAARMVDAVEPFDQALARLAAGGSSSGAARRARAVALERARSLSLLHQLAR
jgi:capsid assembly protease